MALFKAYFGTSEIITSLMLTFVALYLMRWLIFGSTSFWRDPAASNFPQGKKIDAAAELPLFGNYRTGWGLIIVIAIAVLIWVVLRFTSTGYDMNVVGSSPAAARYAGISATGVVITGLLISGALGGIAGGVEVAGRAHALDPNGLELGLGFTGIVGRRAWRGTTRSGSCSSPSSSVACGMPGSRCKASPGTGSRSRCR